MPEDTLRIWRDRETGILWTMIEIQEYIASLNK